MFEQMDSTGKEVLVRTVWGEARGEPREGRVAVARVIINRWKASDTSIEAICTAPRQFSCWNETDPNKQKMLNASWDDELMLGCLQDALTALKMQPSEDPTKGSKHYHAEDVTPSWAAGKTPVIQIGRHKFYNNIGQKRKTK